jgi:transposase
MQVDETPIRYLDPDVPGKAWQGYLWTYSRPGADVLFDWQTSRGKEAARWLKRFRGYLQVDGYGVYESVASEQKGIVLVGCWAHARRKFVDGLGEDRRAAWVVHQIGLMYEVEKRLRRARAGPGLREAVRRSESVPVLRRIEKALRRWRERLLPRSLFGEAMNYVLARWESLCVYARDGRLAIDNNLVENALRPTAVGKKNWLFIGHPGAGWRGAVLYTILGSCRRAGVDPWEYLQDVLKRLPTMKMSEVKSIVPTAWAKAKKAAARA